MNKSFIVTVLMAIALQTMATATLPKEFRNVLQLVSNNQAVPDRETRSPNDEGVSPAAMTLDDKAVQNVTTPERQVDPRDPPTAPTYDVTVPSTFFPNADFVSYGTNCRFTDTTIYYISGITPMQCGNQFCLGDRKCSHFSYDLETSICKIKSNFGAGSDSAIPASSICGIIPSRACDINAGSISSLMGCISLNF